MLLLRRGGTRRRLDELEIFLWFLDFRYLSTLFYDVSAFRSDERPEKKESERWRKTEFPPSHYALLSFFARVEMLQQRSIEQCLPLPCFQVSRKLTREAKL